MNPTHTYNGVACELVARKGPLSTIKRPVNSYHEPLRYDVEVVRTADLDERQPAPAGYDVELLLNGYWAFRKSGDEHRPFQGRYRTRLDAVKAAHLHSQQAA